MDAKGSHLFIDLCNPVTRRGKKRMKDKVTEGSVKIRSGLEIRTDRDSVSLRGEGKTGQTRELPLVCTQLAGLKTVYINHYVFSEMR